MGNCEQETFHTNDFELEMIESQNEDLQKNLSVTST